MNNNTANYTQYDSYKDTGVEWLGNIPSNWNMLPLKYLFRETSQKGFPNLELLSVYRDYGVVPTNSRDDNHNVPSEDLSGYKKVDVGNLVMNKMKTWQGSICISDYHGIVSPAYYIYKRTEDKNNPRYLHYLLRSSIYVSVYKANSKGIRPGQWDLEKKHFERIPVITPDLETQNKIILLLNKRLEQIDKLIENKKKLIELLQEKRRALISQAVTKGFDPDAKMKDSGVEWIGKIPENWQIIRGKFIFRKVERPVRDNDETITCFRDGEVTKRSNRRMDGFTESLREIGYQGIRQGDLIIHNMDAFAGAVGVSDSDGKGSPVLSVCEAINGDSVIYYAYLIRHMAESLWIEALAKGIRQRSTDFRYETFVQQYLPRPSASEQRTIATKLEKYRNKNKHLIDKIDSQIEVLQEYKNSLIYNAVTGKIKV